MRLQLAALVVLSHISRFDVGRVAVVAFFLLSGYWTVRIWREKFQPHTWRYLLSRYWRIAPLFLIVTLLSAWARNQHLAPANFTLLGLASQDNDPTGVSWSLDIELQFYLVVPILVGLLSSRPIHLAIASLVAVAIGIWLEATYGMVTLLKYLPAFVAGALIYLRNWRPGPVAAGLSLGTFFIASLATSATPFMSKTVPDPFDRDLWALAWAAPLVPFLAWSLTLRSSCVDRHLGNISYPLYLIHFPVLAVTAAGLGDGALAKLVGVGFAAILSIAAYFLVDRPIDHLRVKATERNGLKGL